MTSCLIVQVKGRIGIDDADRLITDLAKETDLDWREEPSADGGHLSAIGDLLLSAVISGAAGKGAEIAAEAAVDRVREVVGRWRDKRLDPPDTEVDIRELPEAGPGAGEAPH